MPPPVWGIRHAGRAIPLWSSFKSTETGIAAFELHPRAVSVSINGEKEFSRFSRPMHALELTRGGAALTTGYQLISLRDEGKSRMPAYQRTGNEIRTAFQSGRFD